MSRPTLDKALNSLLMLRNRVGRVSCFALKSLGQFSFAPRIREQTWTHSGMPTWVGRATEPTLPPLFGESRIQSNGLRRGREVERPTLHRSSPTLSGPSRHTAIAGSTDRDAPLGETRIKMDSADAAR